MRLLILDADSNEGRAIVQSLGARGHALCVAAPRTDSSAFASRYARDAVSYPDPLTDRAAFVTWIAGFQAERRFDLIIPPTERTLVPLHGARDVPALRGVVAMASAEAVDAVLDKERLRRLAVSLGVPAPENALVERAEELADPRIDAWLADGAVVVKSVRSKVWDGDRAEDVRVQVVTSRAELDKVVRQKLAITPVQIQRWVPGVGVGIEILAREGEIVLSFAHERIHELPLTGGGSSYRKAVAPPPALLRDSAALMRALAWHGVAMVEFRMDPATGAYWLMEINGRFWGSLPLAIFAGADFPAALVDMLLEGKTPSGPAPRTGVYARQVSRDVLWLKAILKNRSGGRYLLTRPLGPSLLEWGRVLTGKETWDGGSLRDPVPLAHELYQTVLDEIDVVRRKAQRSVLLRRAQAAGRKRLAAGGARRVLVLCYGNICRSAYVGTRLAARGDLGGVEVREGGFHPRGGRSTPADFAEVARRRGVELGPHRSRIVTRADVDWADLVVIMDQKNHEALAALHPGGAEKALWLGAAAGDAGGPEIEDPFDTDEARMNAVLDRMDRAVDALAQALRRR